MVVGMETIDFEDASVEESWFPCYTVVEKGTGPVVKNHPRCCDDMQIVRRSGKSARKFTYQQGRSSITTRRSRADFQVQRESVAAQPNKEKRNINESQTYITRTKQYLVCQVDAMRTRDQQDTECEATMRAGPMTVCP